MSYLVKAGVIDFPPRFSTEVAEQSTTFWDMVATLEEDPDAFPPINVVDSVHPGCLRCRKRKDGLLLYANQMVGAEFVRVVKRSTPAPTPKKKPPYLPNSSAAPPPDYIFITEPFSFATSTAQEVARRSEEVLGGQALESISPNRVRESLRFLYDDDTLSSAWNGIPESQSTTTTNGESGE